MIWLQLTAGRGPGECQMAVKGLVAAVEAEARAAGLAVRLLEAEAASLPNPPPAESTALCAPSRRGDDDTRRRRQYT